ncbi:MAG: DUF4157 domain-containing protein [Methylococcaceae bacterium]|nr:DUF4157 domain-containing protein [Methylococcaceae bacterium]
MVQRQAEESEESVQSLRLQRQEQAEEESVQQKPIQRQDEESTDETVQRKPSEAGANDQLMTATSAHAIHNRGSGQPLSSSIKQAVEPTLGADLSGVRVHDDSTAQQAASAIKARAFTHKNHIWLGKGQSADDLKLMSHELTHVVQQGAAQSSSPSLGSVQRSSSQVFSVSHGASSQKAAKQETEEDKDIVQRWSIKAGIRSVGRFAGGVIKGAANMGRRALVALIRRVAPNFAEMIEQGGIVNTMRTLVGKALRSMFGGFLGRIQGAAVFQNALGMFTRAAGMFRTIAAQLAANNCSGILQIAGQIGSFMSSIFGQVFKGIGRAASSISGVFRSILTAVGVPILEILKKIGGAVWSGIQSFANMIGGILSKVRSAVGRAWSKVKGWFGLPEDTSTGENGGVWNWIKRKANSVWEWGKGIVRPMLGPLKTAGKILLLLSPIGPILAAIAAWPHLNRAFGWLQRTWSNLNLIPRAHQLLANTVFPALTGAFNSVAGALKRAAGWVTGMIRQGANAVLGLLQALGGQTLLAPLAKAVSFVSSKFNQLAAWVTTGIHSAVGGIANLFRSAVRFLRPVWGVLKRLIAIVVNPFGIPGLLLGSLWKALPECLKGPIIDFIISILSRFVRAIPSNPVLGLLWPVIKSAMLGFLDRVLTYSLERKVNVSNKMANIISGGSVTFALGYLKGLALGVWDGVVGPFLAIRDLFQLPGLISNFVSHIAEHFSDLVTEARAMLSTLSERVESSVDSLINAAKDLLDNPRRILDMISTAVDAALSAVGNLGASLADQMMALFEGADDQIGEMLGKVTGSFAVQAVLSFFTAGGAGAASAISRIAGILARIGSKIMPVLRSLVSYFPRVLGFVKKIANMFSRAKSAAGRMLQRIQAFFERIYERLQNMVHGVRKRIGRGINKVKNRFRRGPRNSGERTGSSNARALASRIARGITAINDVRNTPVGMLIGQLMLLKIRFPWIHRFEARPKGSVGHYSIHMIASDIDIDDDYTLANDDYQYDQDDLKKLRIKNIGRKGENVRYGDRPTIKGNQRHHVIPYELRKHNAIQEIEREFGSYIDEPHNILNLPNKGVPKVGSPTPHLGSHPRYTEIIEARLDNVYHEYRMGNITIGELKESVDMIKLEKGSLLELGKLRLKPPR